MKKLILASALSLGIFTGAFADPYLGVRPAVTLDEGASLGTYQDGWDQVILDISDQGEAVVLTQDAMIEAFGSLEEAQALAMANSATARETLDLVDLGGAVRAIVEPGEAISGMLLVDGFLDHVVESQEVDKVNFALPTSDLLVLQTLFDEETNGALAQFATQYANGAPKGLDDQILGYEAGEITLIAAANFVAPTPTAEEILMSLGQDPENTIVITLKDGDVVIRMREDVAPNHVARIKELARDGFYDGIVFHRVIPGFMAQTGDPSGTGTSGSGQNLNAEFSDAPFLRGTVGMARAQSPNSADSQFFIMFDEGRFLDNNYTVVGQVESGMEFVDMIKVGEPPVNPDQMMQVRVQADIAE